MEGLESWKRRREMREIGPNLGRASLRRVSVRSLELRGTAPTRKNQAGRRVPREVGRRAHQQTDNHFIPSRPALTCSAFIDKAGIAWSSPRPPSPVPGPDGHLHPLPSPSPARPLQSLLQTTADHISDTTTPRGAWEAGPAMLVPGNHRLSLIPIFPGIPGPGRR